VGDDLRKALVIRRRLLELGAGHPQPFATGGQAGDFEAEAPAVACRRRLRSLEDRKPGRACLEEGVAVVEGADQHPQADHIPIPLDELTPPRRAQFDREQLRGTMGAHGCWHASGGLRGESGPRVVPGETVAGTARLRQKPRSPGKSHETAPHDCSSADDGPTVRVAGRIMLLRSAGSLVFIDLHDRTGRIQIMLGKKQVGPETWKVVDCLDLGDVIGVDGRLGWSKTGEMTVFAAGLEFLTKSLETPPDKYHGLVDPELKQRMRYLDLIHGEGVRDRFVARSRIVEAVRRVLAARGYLEVEGPTLQESAGGAAARPFKTHHNALDMPLVLRIALELHLKRLLVGGMERVFELGRVYRNEGVSPRHNPEFTMLEAYEAYGDYV
jgi:lysyl-tRNA synthetase class II